MPSARDPTYIPLHLGPQIICVLAKPKCSTFNMDLQLANAALVLDQDMLQNMLLLQREEYRRRRGERAPRLMFCRDWLRRREDFGQYHQLMDELRREDYGRIQELPRS